MKKMKIVYIHHSGAYGGSSRSIGILISQLKKLGVEPHIITPKGKASSYFKQITPNVYTLHHKSFPLLMTIVGRKNNRFNFFRNLLMVPNIKRIKKIVQKIKPDIIHFNEIGLIPIGRALKKQGKYPIVVHARTMPHKDFPLLNQYTLNQITNYADHLICISGSVSHAMDIITNKTVIYNPVEQMYSLNEQNKSKVINFLSLAALRKSKGIFDILYAAKKISNDKRINILIAGGITRYKWSDLSIKQKLLQMLGLADFKEMDRIDEIINENKLSNITLLGHVSDIHQLFNKVDVLLAPMHLNAPPRSVFEAGIHGIPSILSMEDKVEDVIENNVNGILINEQCPNELVDAMLELTNKPEWRRTLGIAARERFLENHNPEKIANSVFDIYKSIIKKE